MRIIIRDRHYHSYFYATSSDYKKGILTLGEEFQINWVLKMVIMNS